MSKPDSLMVATRQLGDAAGLTWAELQPFYRGLQERGGERNRSWLPKSSGRTIWAAQPVMIARLLFALGGARTVSEAHHAVELAIALTPKGRPVPFDEQRCSLDHEFIHLLTSPQAAAGIEEVEFRSDRAEIIIIGATRRTFSLPDARGGEMFRYHMNKLIYRRGVIKGEVFAKMAANVKWSLAENEVPISAA